MVKISYIEQTWNNYDDSKTADENLANGAIINADRLNHMESGISNNDTNNTNKVNISDMRKSANDVAGIDEIQGTSLANGTDLYTLINTSRTANLYYVSSTAAAATIKNIPNTEAFSLMCLPVSPSSTTWNITILVFKSASSKKTWYASIGTNGSGNLVVNYPWSTHVIDNQDGSVYVNGIKMIPANTMGSNSFTGSNNFMIIPTYGTNNKPFAINDTGATTARPTGQAVGYQYFDTTLNKPIWYNGSNWVDSTGTTV